MEVEKFINKKEEAFWVDFEGDAEILIKPITPKQLRKIKKKCTTKKFKRGRETEVFDDERFTKILNKEVVLDWKNFTADGKEVPFSPENLTLFMDKWTEFNLFVQDAGSNIRAYIEDEKEESEKN